MKLTVKPLKQKDAGRGLAAIDRVSMRELDLENGESVKARGGWCVRCLDCGGRADVSVAVL